jgi:hypothetical protein
MGRFQRIDGSEIRRSVILGQPECCLDEDDLNAMPSQDENSAGGNVRIAETGHLKPNPTTPMKRLASAAVLAMNRMLIFRSPEYRQRISDDLGRAACQKDPTRTTAGLLWTALDPRHRDTALGDRWEAARGVPRAQAHQELVDEARDSYEKDMKIGAYQRQGSRLRFSTAPSPVKEAPPVRRSERLKQQQQRRPPTVSPPSNNNTNLGHHHNRHRHRHPRRRRQKK